MQDRGSPSNLTRAEVLISRGHHWECSPPLRQRSIMICQLGGAVLSGYADYRAAQNAKIRSQLIFFVM